MKALCKQLELILILTKSKLVMFILIGARFRKLATYQNAQIPIGPYGVIPATWVNGTFYIKRIREYETVRQWDALPCKQLVFNKLKIDDCFD